MLANSKMALLVEDTESDAVSLPGAIHQSCSLGGGTFHGDPIKGTSSTLLLVIPSATAITIVDESLTEVESQIVKPNNENKAVQATAHTVRVHPPALSLLPSLSVVRWKDGPALGNTTTNGVSSFISFVRFCLLLTSAN